MPLNLYWNITKAIFFIVGQLFNLILTYVHKMQELVCSIKQYAVRNDWINVELDTEKHSLQINEVTFSFSLLYSKLFQEYY